MGGAAAAGDQGVLAGVARRGRRTGPPTVQRPRAGLVAGGVVMRSMPPGGERLETLAPVLCTEAHWDYGGVRRGHHRSKAVLLTAC